LIALRYYRGEIDDGLALHRAYAQRRLPNPEPLLAFARDLERYGARHPDQTGRLSIAQEKRLLEALDRYHELRALEPGRVSHQRRIALLHAALSEPRGAVFWARRALSVNGDDTQMLQVLVDGLSETEDWDSLIPAAESLLRFEGFEELYRPVLANAYAERERWSDAITQMELYHASGFGDPASHLAYAGYLSGGRRFALAIAEYQRLIRGHSPAASPSSDLLWVEPRVALGYLLVDRAVGATADVAQLDALLARARTQRDDDQLGVLRVAEADLNRIADTRLPLRWDLPADLQLNTLRELRRVLIDAARSDRAQALDVFQPLLDGAARGAIVVYDVEPDPELRTHKAHGLLAADRDGIASACVYAASELGWHSEAAARARAILDARPNDWDTRRALAYALEAAGDADGALAIWRAEAQRIPADPEVYRAWFDLLEAQAQPALADDALHPLTRVGRRAEPHATLPPPLLHDPRYAMLFDHIQALEPLAEADRVMAAWAARVPAPLTLARAYWYAISRGDRRTAARYLDAHLNLVPDESD
jgi:tetratricopeptide (TPR) repeat protein